MATPHHGEWGVFFLCAYDGYMAAEEMKIEILICGRATDKLGREIQGATSNKSNSSECRIMINMGQNKQKS